MSGQGELQFEVLYRADHLPEEAQAVLGDAHGGFGIDRRPGKGEIYFALPGAGIIEISGDLSKTRMIETPDVIKQENMHNAAVWYGPKYTPYLVLPGVDVGKIFTTTLTGTLIDTLGTPSNDFEFSDPEVNAYFDSGDVLVPTDVAMHDGMYYITTGYSDLDYVLTATMEGDKPAFNWNALAFAGRGDGAGELGTGHGIAVSPDGTGVDVADRPNSEIDRFSAAGKYLDTVHLPEGSFPCDIDYAAGYAVVGCLHGPDRELGAPIYILKDGDVVSTVMPKEELGLEKFQHLHNAVMVEVGGVLHIVAQAWNPGDFVILRQVGK
jgi:hypothetical protein